MSLTPGASRSSPQPAPSWRSREAKGAGDGQFSYLSGLAIDSAGAVYAADPGTDPGTGQIGNPPRIQKFSSSGAFITKFGCLGYGDGQFDNVTGVAVDRFGGVYVAEATNTNNNHRIQKFKPVQ